MTTVDIPPTVAGADPHTGLRLRPAAAETTPATVAKIIDAAEAAAPELAALGRSGRAALLRGLANAIEAHRSDLLTMADSETALGAPRLGSEITRTAFQLRFFAEVLDEGSYLEATIDTAADTLMGPRPDLRRLLVPIGPVAVFGASNFPFAFSVPGGDTASALAAGSPVVVKAHGSHPGTSQLAYEVLAEGLRAAGGAAGTIGIVFGRAAGETLVSHPSIRAVGFTGSLSGGRTLLEAIGRRDDPIPFYGELSSLNPLVVTAAAAAERAEQIGEAVIRSVTGSAGQLCTKPGLLLVPAGDDGDQLVAAAAAALVDAPVVPLLNDRIHRSYVHDTAALAMAPGVFEVSRSARTPKSGFHASALLVTVDAPDVSSTVFDEYFGPAAVIVRYRTTDELMRVLELAPASLTATLHIGSAEIPTELVRALGRVAGRIVFDDYPTGVSVSWAQHHGGPWPATNSLHTSVGATAIRRFLRPLTWQNAPQDLLPVELRDGSVDIPRRVDGAIQMPQTGTTRVL